MTLEIPTVEKGFLPRLLDRLGLKRRVWEQEGQIKWLDPFGEIKTFTPKDSKDLPQIKSLVKDLNKAARGKTGLAELKQEEIEEDLLPLLSF